MDETAAVRSNNVPTGIPKPSRVYTAGKFMFKVMFGTLWRARISGHENIPVRGGAIIASNHLSYADPPFINSAVRRPVFSMAKKELFETPVLGFFMRRVNSFPVKRGQRDIGAFRTAQRLLERGDLVLMFPEGTRSKDGKLRPAQPGLGMLACTARVPVIPTRLVNTDRLARFSRLRIMFGKPLYPPAECTRETYQEFSEQVMAEIRRLG